MNKLELFNNSSPSIETLFKRFDVIHKGNLYDDYLHDADKEGFIKTLIYEWSPIWMTSDDYDAEAVKELIDGLRLFIND